MNFFKKLLTKKPKEEEKEKKTLSYNEIPGWIKKEKEQISSEEKEIIQKINERINLFVEEIKENIKIAKNVDLSSKKAEERLKAMSQDGRKKYLEFLEDFVEKLKDQEENNLLKTEQKISRLFSEFTKASEKNYQRSTILIGKEMADIKQLIKKLSQDLKQIFEMGKEAVISKKRLFSMEEKINEFNETENKEKEIIEELLTKKKELNEEKEKKEEILLQIDKIKNSKEYEENLKNKKEIKEIKEKIEREIFELKQEIDFKKLSNFYHSLEKGLESVKKFRDDFKEEFYSNNGEEKLITLLKDAKMFSEKIENRLNNIKKLNEEVSQKKQKITKNKIPEIESNLETSISNIEELEKEKSLNEKQSENLKIQKKDLVEKIKDELSQFDIELKGEIK